MWRKKDKKALSTELSPELVSWGDWIAEFYNMPPEDDRPTGDDLVGYLDKMPPPPPPTAKGATPKALTKTPMMPRAQESIFKDRAGKVMPCIVCSNPYTFDGRYCQVHRD